MAVVLHVHFDSNSNYWMINWHFLNTLNCHDISQSVYYITVTIW